MKPALKYFNITIASLLLISCQNLKSNQEKDLITSLDSLVISEINEKKIPSIAIGIVKDGSPVVAKAFGLADVEANIKADANTVYQLGSVTKMFTGHVLASLIDEGKISISDTLATYFPDSLNFPVSPTGQIVTIKEIATHSSEFPRYPFNLEREDPHPIKGYTYEQMLEGISNVEIDTLIGTRYSYSNFGFGVLGAAMENHTGQSLPALMDSRIFSKYEMKNSSLVFKEEFAKKLATPYLETQPPLKTEPWEMGKLAAAGNVFSTVNDLNKLMIGMLNNSEINTIQQKQYFSINETWSYGLGCFIVYSEKQNTQLIYHGGDIDGYASSLTLYPEYGLGVVILTNWGEGQSIGDAFDGIYSIVNDHFLGKNPDETKN